MARKELEKRVSSDKITSKIYFEEETGEKGKTREKQYTINIKKTDKRVNLKNALCYVLNLMNLGKKPPTTEHTVTVNSPVPWRKLQNGIWAEDWEEFEEIKKMAKKGKLHPKMDKYEGERKIDNY